MLNKLNENSRKLPALGSVGIAAVVTMILLIAGPMSAIAQTAGVALTEDDLSSQTAVEETIRSIQASIAEVDTISDNADLRFSPVGFVEPDGGQAILVVECMPDEFPTGVFKLFSSDVRDIYAFPAGLNGDNVGLFVLAENDGEERQAVAVGTLCLDEDSNNGANGDDNENSAEQIVVTDGTEINNVIQNIFRTHTTVVNNNVTVISNNTNNNNNTVVLPPPVDNGTDTGGNDTDTDGNDTDTTVPPPVENTTTTVPPPVVEEPPVENTTAGALLPEEETTEQPTGFGSTIPPAEEETETTVPSVEEEETTTGGGGVTPDDTETTAPTEEETETTAPTEEETDTEEEGSSASETPTESTEEPISQTGEDEDAVAGQ